MEIGRIQGATRVLGKSQGYYGLPVRDEAQNLGDLPHMLHTMKHDSVTGPDTPVMVTAWLPSPDELAALAAGAPIFVKLVGIAHPPIMVSVGDAPGPVECGACKGTGLTSCGSNDCSTCQGKGSL